MLIAHLFNDRRDHGECEGSNGAPASLTSHDLIVAAVKRTDEDWLEDAVFTDARRQVAQGAWVGGDSWLLRIRRNAINGNLPNGAIVLFSLWLKK